MMMIITPWPHFFQSLTCIYSFSPFPLLQPQVLPSCLILLLLYFPKNYPLVHMSSNWNPLWRHHQTNIKEELFIHRIGPPKIFFSFSPNCLPIKFKVFTLIFSISYNLAPALIFQCYLVLVQHKKLILLSN